MWAATYTFLTPRATSHSSSRSAGLRLRVLLSPGSRRPCCRASAPILTRVTPYLLQDLIATAPVLVWDVLLEGKPEIWCSFLLGHLCFLLRLMVSKLNKDVSWYEMLFINFLWNSVKFHVKGSFPSLQLCQWAEDLSGSSSVWGPWLYPVVCHHSLPSVSVILWLICSLAFLLCTYLFICWLSQALP